MTRFIERGKREDICVLLRIIAEGDEKALQELEPADPLFKPEELGWIALLYKELGRYECTAQRTSNGWWVTYFEELGLLQWRRGTNRFGHLGAYLVVKLDFCKIVNCDPANKHNLPLRKLRDPSMPSFTPAYWAACPESSALGSLYSEELVD